MSIGKLDITKADLFGRVIQSINGLEKDSNYVSIHFKDGGYIEQSHEQDCCETVLVEQVDGDPSKHEGAIIHEIIEKVLTSDEMNPADLPESMDASLTATFYTLKTSKGYLDWRWYGESNGYYSESVECKLKQGNNNGNN